MVSELPLDSFNAYQWKKGTTAEKEYQADILIKNSGLYGISGIYDEGQIVNPNLRAATHRAIDLFFNLPQEVKISCISQDDLNLGYYKPGREDYGDGPEWWKEFVRVGYRGDKRKYPQDLWPKKEVLDKHLTADDAAFLDHFQRVDVYDFFDQYIALSTVALNAIAHHYLGLSGDFFDSSRVVDGQSYKMVEGNTLQMIKYRTTSNLSGEVAKLGDPLFRKHRDSSTGTIGDMSKDPEHCLEVEINENEWVAPILPTQHFFFQFGVTYSALILDMAQRQEVDLDKLAYREMKATLHRGIRKNIDQERSGLVAFNHPQLTMPILDSTAGKILTGHLFKYILSGGQS